MNYYKIIDRITAQDRDNIDVYGRNTFELYYKDERVRQIDPRHAGQIDGLLVVAKSIGEKRPPLAGE